MKANVGSYDCALRFVLGCLILGLARHGLGWWALLGLLPIVSAMTHYCFVYRLCHLDSAVWEEHYEQRHGRY